MTPEEPIEQAPKPKTRMQLARERLLEDLGCSSSHPSFAVRRLRIARALALLPIAFALGLLAWRVWRSVGAIADFEFGRVLSEIVPLLNEIFATPPRLMVGLACACSVILTAALTIRASVLRDNAEPARTPGFGWGSTAVASILAMLACVGVAWLASTDSVDLSTRWWVIAGSMVPMYLMLLVLDWSAPAGDRSMSAAAIVKAIFWTLSIPIGLATLLLAVPAASQWLTEAVFSLLGGLSSILSLGGLGAFAQRVIEQKVGGVISQFVGMAAALSVILIVTFRVSGIHRDAEAAVRGMRGRLDATGIESRSADAPTVPEPAEADGCVGRVLIGVLKLLGISADDPASVEPAATDSVSEQQASSVAEQLQKKARDAGYTVEIETLPVRPLTDESSAASPEVEDDDLNWLFGGMRPSTDQRMLFESFQLRWEEHLRAVRDAVGGPSRASHADILVESEVGSGITEVLAACAVFACVARGQRVLILTRSRAEADAKVRAMRRSLESMGFDPLYSVEPLNRDTTARWCSPAHATAQRVEAAPPDIAVASVEDYEEVFFSGAYEPALLAAVQRSLEVVIVEALDTLVEADSCRLHLPFILDKHRLMLRTENRAMQLLLTVSPLGASGDAPRAAARRGSLSTAARKLAERFFGGDGALDTKEGGAKRDNLDRQAAHFTYLRRRAVRRPATIIVEADVLALTDIRSWIVTRLLAQGKVAVITLDNRLQRAEQSLRYRATARTVSVTSVDRMHADRDALVGVEWFVVDGTPGPEARRLIDAFVGSIRGAKLALVQGERTRESEPRQRPTLPVFPTPTSPALFVSHLRSVAAMLTPDVPNRREDFARFGLGWDERGWRMAAEALKPILLHENWWIEFDGSIDDLKRGNAGVWPAVFVRHESGLAPRAVDLLAPPRSGLCMVPQGNRLQIGQAPEHDDPRRFATWITRRGLHLGQTDLAYFRPVTFDATRQEFRAIDLEQSADGVVVIAEPRSDDLRDFVLPVRRTKLTLPTDMALDGPSLLRSLNAFVFRMRETSRFCVADEQIVALETTTLHGASERRAIDPIEFRMHAGVTILSIGGTMPKSDFENVIRARFEGTWDTGSAVHPHPRGRDPWHGLTRAFTYAIEQVAPSLLRFMNAYGFHPPNGTDGATILLVEPAATQGTAIEAITTILDDAALRARFLEEFRRAADEALRAESAMRIDGDELEDAAASSRDLGRLLELLECGPVAPIEDAATPSRDDAALITPPLRSHDHPFDTGGARVPVPVAETANHRWRDVNASGFDGWESLGSAALEASPEYGVLLDLAEAVARAETEAFGWHESLHGAEQEALRRACIEVVAHRTRADLFVYGPDYGAMIERNAPMLRPIAERILALAAAGGLESTRDKIGLIASMVQSFEYVRDRAGDIEDGKDRCGVQMPAATLHARKGDCDSVAVLIACLIRSVGLARCGIVLVEEADGGHAMAAVECDIRFGDSVIQARAGRLVMVEATSPWRLGQVSPEYHGRRARLVAFQ